MRYLIQTLILAITIFGFQPLATAKSEDVRTLAERLERKAVSGDIRAGYKLGLLFYDGKMIEPNYFIAKEWFLFSAERNYVSGMLKMAQIYNLGQGVPVNHEKAFVWTEKAALNGSVTGMVDLAHAYASGKGTPADLQKATNWYQKAAIKGHKEAMTELGTYYLKGEGVRFDLAHAYAWFYLANKKGEREAGLKLQRLKQEKGSDWTEQIEAQIQRRMIPAAYWDAN